MRFRHDINGLRAIAVISVVLFHFFPTTITGGFVGVDVFFVISGYLMTGIIFRSLGSNNFSVFKFYVDRTNRIVPALLFLCFTLISCGVFILNAIDLKDLAKHIIGSVTFLSNFMYWNEAGYFNASAHEKWLLHTWSLSVEWQFYLIYPLALVLINRFFSFHAVKKIILLATALTFVFSIFASHKWPEPAYYLLPTRVWELLLGALAFLYPLNFAGKKSKYIELLGYLLVLVSIFLMNGSMPWPGYHAALPVFGTYLVVLSNRQDSKVSNNKIMQSLGLWSYSIYLWHWPIVVVGKYYNVTYWSLVGIPLSFLLGYLSWRFIERIKLPSFNEWSNIGKVKPAVASLLLAGLGLFIYRSDGLLFRYSGEQIFLYRSAMESESDWNYPAPNLMLDGIELRFIDRGSDKNILLMGASHIEQTFPYVSSIDADFNIYYLTVAGCFPTPSMEHPRWSCANLKQYQRLLELVDFERIVVGFYNFDSNLPKLKDMREEALAVRMSEFDLVLKRLKAHTNDVYLVLGDPQGREFNPKVSMRYSLQPYIALDVVKRSYEESYYALSQLQELEGVKLIDPLEYLCADKQCPTFDYENGFYYRDDTHMRPWYAKAKLNFLGSIFGV